MSYLRVQRGLPPTSTPPQRAGYTHPYRTVCVLSEGTERRTTHLYTSTEGRVDPPPTGLSVSYLRVHRETYHPPLHLHRRQGRPTPYKTVCVLSEGIERRTTQLYTSTEGRVDPPPTGLSVSYLRVHRETYHPPLHLHRGQGRPTPYKTVCVLSEGIERRTTQLYTSTEGRVDPPPTGLSVSYLRVHRETYHPPLHLHRGQGRPTPYRTVCVLSEGTQRDVPPTSTPPQRAG